MNLIVSYHHLAVDWYVGEFYIKFLNFLKEIPGINVEYVHSAELANKYGCGATNNNGLPSIFNPYNLIIMNKDNGKTFVHSWNDYAPCILEERSGINNLDVVKFACVSRLDQGIIDNYKGNVIIQPSFFYLERMSDIDLIEKNKTNPKIHDKAYMNALCHSNRERFIDVFNQSERFDLKKKDGADFLSKEDYFNVLSQHKFGLNLDGAAKICYRDLETFGLGVLSLRENLNVLTHEPLTVNEHYLELIDDDIKSKINIDTEIPYIIEKIESKMNDSVSSGQYEYIVNQAHGWYERNCLPDNQIKILFSFLENFEILK